MADNIAAFRPSYRPAPSDSVFSPDMRRMAIAATALTVVLTLVVAGWHMMGHTQAGVPVIEAQSGPVRIKPEHAGGMIVAGATTGSPQDQAEKLAPPAEQPELAVLRAKLRATQKKLARQQAELEQAHVSPRITPAPPVQRAAALAPLDLNPPAVMTPFPMPPITATSADGTAIQLAAFDSEAAARADWSVLQKKLPALLGHRAPDIERAEVAGHPVWRLRTGGFANVASAATFCARLRAQGADCKIAAF
jgi:hypothetical protein